MSEAANEIEGNEKDSVINFINPAMAIKQAVDSTGGLTVWMTVLLLVGEMAGLGVLALPKALSDSGWTGLVIIILGCGTAGFNGVHLGYCWNIVIDRYPEYNQLVRDPYASIAEKAVGKWMRHVVSVSIYITLFGACTLFILLVSENMHSLSHAVGVDVPFCLWILIIGVVLIPLSWFGSPKDFWWVALFSASSSVIGSILMAIGFIMKLSSQQDNPPSSPVSFTSFFLAFGAIMFAYGGASTFPTIQHDMKKPEKFHIAVICTFAILLALYLPPAITGYIACGSDINANALLSLPSGGLRMTIEILFTIHLFFAFIIALNPCVLGLENMINIPHSFNWKRVLMRSIAICVMIFVAESIPHFGALLSLVGGSTITLLTFVAPSIFYLCLCSQEGDWPKRSLLLHEKVLHIEIILLGCLGGITSTYSAIKEIASPETFIPPCYVNSSINS